MSQNMVRDNVVRGPLAASGRSLALVAGVAIFATVIFLLLPGSISQDSMGVVAVGAFFVVLLCFGIGTTIGRQTGTKAIVYRLSLLIWWFLLVCDVIFDHSNENYQMYQGKFSSAVYGEAAMWILAFLVLLFISAQQPSYFRRLFSGSSKWISLFTLVCLLSIAYAPGKFYSAGWGFKLLLVILLLELCGSLMQSLDDVVGFLKATMWALLFLTIIPVLTAFSNPATAFFEGRLNGNPDLLSPTAASLLLVAMTLYSIEKKKSFFLVGFVGLAVMFLAFGKAGVASGLLAALIFLLLQKKVVRSLGLLLGSAALATLIISVTPLANYVQTYKGSSTLTGRTSIWAVAIQAVRQHLLFGHGYLASYFSWKSSSDLPEGYVHLHNGFVEVAYNNGLIGLALLIAIHVAIIRNIFLALRTGNALRERFPKEKRAVQAYLLPIGLLAIYVNLFIQGMFGATFGGRAMAPYMLFLGLFVVADAVKRLNLAYWNLVRAQTDEPSELVAQPDTPARRSAHIPWLIPRLPGSAWQGRKSEL